MSFLSDIGDFFTENPIASSFVTLAGLALVTKLVNNNTSPTPQQVDAGVRQQLSASIKNAINVLYGDAYISGPIIDAQMSSDAKTMWYCIVLSEKTGTKLSDGLASSYAFKELYWNDQKIVFHDDGITANYTIDKSGNVDRNINNLVQVYCYGGNSDTNVIPDGYTNPALTPAYSVMPNWTNVNNPMNDLVFVVVKVTYSSSNNITGLPTMAFRVANTMNLPGDVIYDYMSNTRYGAGIADSGILKS